MGMHMARIAALALFGASSVFCAESSCEEKLFSNFSANKGTQIVQVVDQLSSYCGFSVIIKDDEAQRQLERTLNTVNLRNFSLPDILNFVLGENNFNYEYKNGVLKIGYIETKTFRVDYLRTKRSGTSGATVSVSGSGSATLTGGASGGTATTSTSGAVGTGGASANSGTTASSGNTNIMSVDDSFDFWTIVESNVKSILTSSSSSQQPSVTQSPPIDQIGVPSIPTTLSVSATSTQSDSVVVNKEAGLITVTANREKLQQIQNYLDSTMERLHRQVLIDVKILSVNLDNSKKTGIDWSKLDLGLKHNSGYSQAAGGTTLGDLAFGSAMTVLNSASFSMDGLVKFLGTYGDVKSLSNPKLLALNNQPALISSGDRFYYVTTGTTTSAAGTTGTTSTTTTVSDVFAGVMLDITPEILDDDTILIKINPAITTPRDSSILSSSTQSATGQAVTRAAPPDMKVKQISSVAKVKNGEKIILGGLISDDNDIKTNKVPLLGDIPLFGHLFKSQAESKNFSELVIIITPHIVKKERALSLGELGYKHVEVK